jgi:hypothetical protein
MGIVAADIRPPPFTGIVVVKKETAPGLIV